jgi:hypothetical protein
VLRSRGREFYNVDVQPLTQRWQKCFENGEESVGKLPRNIESCMNNPCKFHLY